jgi:tryptophan 2,3-dioxygenase
MDINKLVKQIEEKCAKSGENFETLMEGTALTVPLTYWDYIQVETLLSLQRPKTHFKDEAIFIIYHQVTELVLKLIMNEIEQITGDCDPDADFIAGKIRRATRYTKLLINSFDIMREGMDYDDYNIFRKALAPASGFQSAQFRFIELRCTSLPNLINEEGKKRLPENPTTQDYFEQIYWKDAGTDRKTGEKTLTLQLFEQKYTESFMRFADKMNGKTLEDKIKKLPEITEELGAALREFDEMYNIHWPLVHLNTAKHFLDSKNENQAATGGSEWKKYLHPRFQQRKFFPSLWSDDEKNHWADKF